MREISLFVEDSGHEIFLKALIGRYASQYGIEITIYPYSISGGHGNGYFLTLLLSRQFLVGDALPRIKNVNAIGISFS